MLNFIFFQKFSKNLNFKKPKKNPKKPSKLEKKETYNQHIHYQYNKLENFVAEKKKMRNSKQKFSL